MDNEIFATPKIDYFNLFLLIPEEFDVNFIAMDEDNEIWGYEVEPVFSNESGIYYGMSKGGKATMIGMYFLFDNVPAAEDSLIKRHN